MVRQVNMGASNRRTGRGGHRLNARIARAPVVSTRPFLPAPIPPAPTVGFGYDPYLHSSIPPAPTAGFGYDSNLHSSIARPPMVHTAMPYGRPNFYAPIPSPPIVKFDSRQYLTTFDKENDFRNNGHPMTTLPSQGHPEVPLRVANAEADKVMKVFPNIEKDFVIKHIQKNRFYAQEIIQQLTDGVIHAPKKRTPVKSLSNVDSNLSVTVEGDYSKGVIEKFFNKISLKELKKVDAIHLTLNPRKSNVPRRLLLVSKETISKWDPQWQAINSKNSIPKKLLDEQTKQKKVVQEHYKGNKDSFEDVSRLVSQIQIENATDVHGGSFLLHSQGPPYRGGKRNLALIFLHLARALNRGIFDVDSTFTISLKIFPENRSCRVKLDMMDSSCQMDEILSKIQQVLKRRKCEGYNLSVKTHVASYLEKLDEIKKSGIIFEPPMQSITKTIDPPKME